MAIYWVGNVLATDEIHDRVFALYGHRPLVTRRWAVSIDFDACRIDDSADASNGIWTLAEVYCHDPLALGLLADAMDCAVAVAERSERQLSDRADRLLGVSTHA